MLKDINNNNNIKENDDKWQINHHFQLQCEYVDIKKFQNW